MTGETSPGIIKRLRLGPMSPLCGTNVDRSQHSRSRITECGSTGGKGPSGHHLLYFCPDHPLTGAEAPRSPALLTRPEPRARLPTAS